MSHPKVYEATRFFNDTVNEKARSWKKVPGSALQESFVRSPPSSPMCSSPQPSPSGKYAPVSLSSSTRSESFSTPTLQSPGRCRTPRFGDIGSALDLAFPITRSHSLTYNELGIKGAGQVRSFSFTRLPGRTFNNNTFSKFSDTARIAQEATASGRCTSSLARCRSVSPTKLRPRGQF